MPSSSQACSVGRPLGLACTAITDAFNSNNRIIGQHRSRPATLGIINQARTKPHPEIRLALRDGALEPVHQRAHALDLRHAPPSTPVSSRRVRRADERHRGEPLDVGREQQPPCAPIHLRQLHYAPSPLAPPEKSIAAEVEIDESSSSSRLFR